MIRFDVSCDPYAFDQAMSSWLNAKLTKDLRPFLRGLFAAEQSSDGKCRGFIVRTLTVPAMKWGHLVATVHDPEIPLTPEQEHRIAKKLEELLVKYAPCYRSDKFRIGVTVGRLTGTFRGAAAPKT